MATKANDRILMTVFTGRITVFIGRGDVFVHEQVQGSTGRPLKFTFYDQDRNALDLGDSGGKLTMIKLTSGTRVIDQQSMVSGDASGNIQYNWASGDLDEVGLYRVEIKLTEDGGSEFTVPETILVDVRRRLSST